MHRATPLNSSFRSFVSGGARSVVDKIDDTKLMQEMGGNFMKGESRTKVEAPQNYGFTSVVFDATKDAMGKIIDGAEVAMGFMGGNRSFPLAGNMDDRRHRLLELAKGDTAMFRGKGDKQQFHMTEDGGYWSAPQNKTVRMQLVSADSEDNASPHVGAVTVLVATAAAAQGGQAQQQQQKKGQKPVYKDGKDSTRYVDVTKSESRVSGDNARLYLSDKKCYVDANEDKNVYVGAKKGDAEFSLVVTLAGPAVNVYGKIG